MTKQLPWEIREVTPSKRGLIHVSGINHYLNGERLSWTLDHYSFDDNSFNATRFDFTNATFSGDSKERLLSVWPTCPLED